MKYLLTFVVSFLICQGVKADVIIQSLEDSQDIEIHNMIMDKSGRIKDQVNTLTTYTYLTNQGDKVEKDYKIKGLPDNRDPGKKHPILKKILIMFDHVTITVPI